MANNYNIQLQSNNVDLQEVLQTLQNKASGGIVLPTLTNPASSDEILNGYEAIDENGEKITGNIATATQATPTITVDSNGLITAKATQTAGYVAGGTKSATKQLAFQEAKTITPTTTTQTAVEAGKYTTGAITVKGDSNLISKNIAKGVSIFGVEGTHSGGGSTTVDDVSKAIIEGTIIEIEDDSIKNIGTYAFGHCTKLTSVNFPVCTGIGSNAFGYCSRLISVNFPACRGIGSNAFQNCTSLTSVNFPACTTISTYAFSNCSKLTSVNFPVCTGIGSYAFSNCSRLMSVNFPACTIIYNNAFYNCTSLTSVNFPACTIICSNAFQNCTSLTSVNFPACTTIGATAFQNCTSLTSVNFPACTTIGSNAFNYCSSLISVNFPACKGIGSFAFRQCTSLTSVNFPACTTISTYAFQKCTSLTTLILGASYVCTLKASNVFTSTPIASGTGYIYVPASLVTAYKAATNWTYFANQIQPIPGSEDSSDENVVITFIISDIDENDISYQGKKNMTWSEWCNSTYNTDGYYEKEGSIVIDVIVMGMTTQRCLFEDNSYIKDCLPEEVIMENGHYYAMDI